MMLHSQSTIQKASLAPHTGVPAHNSAGWESKWHIKGNVVYGGQKISTMMVNRTQEAHGGPQNSIQCTTQQHYHHFGGKAAFLSKKPLNFLVLVVMTK